MTALHKDHNGRTIPDGTQLEWDDTTWNAGHCYMWSDVYDAFMWHSLITVKPGQTLPEAFEAMHDMPMFSEYEIFFSTDV